jgi:protein-tyrosine phosphatase
MIDIHNHILPGLDDGARDWDEAIKLCEMAKNDGIEAIAVTPHIREGLYPNSRDNIIEKANELRERIAGQVDIDIYAGAEVHIATDITDRIKANTIPTINDNGYMLLELPEQVLPPRVEELIFNLKLAGITPIITHPERYGWVNNDMTDLKRFVEMGAHLQITAKSLTGGFGRGARSIARRLLKEGLVAVIASDSHSPGHRPPKLSEACNEAAKIIGKESALELVRENPKRIINGEPLEG